MNAVSGLELSNQHNHPPVKKDTDCGPNNCIIINKEIKQLHLNFECFIWMCSLTISSWSIYGGKICAIRVGLKKSNLTWSASFILLFVVTPGWVRWKSSGMCEQSKQSGAGLHMYLVVRCSCYSLTTTPFFLSFVNMVNCLLLYLD